LSRYLLGVALVGFLAACGGSKPEPIDDGGDGGKGVTDDGGVQDASDGSETDVISAPVGDAAILDVNIPDVVGPVVACTAENLIGSWELIEPTTAGLTITFTFKSDGTWTGGVFEPAPTPVDFYENEEIGTAHTRSPMRL
jgi:hypothetical protein